MKKIDDIFRKEGFTEIVPESGMDDSDNVQGGSANHDPDPPTLTRSQIRSRRTPSSELPSQLPCVEMEEDSECPYQQQACTSQADADSSSSQFAPTVPQLVVVPRPAPVSTGPRVHRMLEFENTCFRSGHEVRGVVVLVLPCAVPAAAVKLLWRGVEQVGAGAGGSKAPQVQVCSLFEQESVLWLPPSVEREQEQQDRQEGTDSDMGTLGPGCVHFSFSWTLPSDLPRSFHAVSESTDNVNAARSNATSSRASSSSTLNASLVPGMGMGVGADSSVTMMDMSTTMMGMGMDQSLCMVGPEARGGGPRGGSASSASTDSFVRYTATLVVDQPELEQEHEHEAFSAGGAGVGDSASASGGGLFESIGLLQRVDPIQVEMQVQEEVDTDRGYAWAFQKLGDTDQDKLSDRDQDHQQEQECAEQGVAAIVGVGEGGSGSDVGTADQGQSQGQGQGQKLLFLNAPVERTGRQVYIFSGGQPCVAKVYLHRPVLLTGGTAKVGVFVLNGSTRHISAFRYRLVKVTQYTHPQHQQGNLNTTTAAGSTAITGNSSGSGENTASTPQSKPQSLEVVLAGEFRPTVASPAVFALMAGSRGSSSSSKAGSSTAGMAAAGGGGMLEPVEAVKPMESRNLEFEISLPSYRQMEGSLLHSASISVTHALVVEMTGKGVAGATLSVSVPVCVIEDK